MDWIVYHDTGATAHTLRIGDQMIIASRGGTKHIIVR